MRERYGFIAVPGWSDDIFFHLADVRQSVKQGDAVAFDLFRNDCLDRTYAVAVRPIQRGAA